VSATTFSYFGPELVVLGTAILVVVAGLFLERGRASDDADRARLVAASLAILGCLIAIGYLFGFVAVSRTPLDPLSGTFVVDHFALYLKIILLLFAVVTILLGYRFSATFRPHQTEFIGLILLATLGGMFMASAREMIELYVALETLSIALYVMVALNKGQRLSSEAGFKYLIVGGASSAVLLYGLAILYGLTGRTNLDAVARAIVAGGASSPALVLASILIIGGLSFKIAAVPFHQWVPDVYQGAPTPVTAFVAVSSKTAGYGLLIRVLTSALLPLSAQWTIYLAVIAAVTMSLGNITALSQTNIKRLLGYSSIAHAGYIVMGLVAIANPSTRSLGIGAVLFYLLTYGLTNLAAFGAVQAVESNLGSDEIGALSGLRERSGTLALVLTLAMLSLTGIPPLIGFFAKVFVFLAAVQAGYAWLGLVAVANSALSAVYYLRVVRTIYLEEGKPGRPLLVGRPMWAALGAGVLAILPLTVVVSLFVDRAQAAARAVFLR
jgi:NADH-quinone oxidoreductase subunit N